MIKENTMKAFYDNVFAMLQTMSGNQVH